MRYLAQFLIPALIVIAVVYLASRSRRQAPPGREPGQPAAGASAGTPAGDTATFIVILVVGAAVAVGTFFALGAWLP